MADEENSLFDGTQNTQTTEGNTGATGTETGKNLEDWVGPGKKYASVEEAAKANIFAQEHIGRLEESYGQLKSQLDELVQKQEQQGTMEDLVQTLAKRLEGRETDTTRNTTGESGQETPDVESLLRQKLPELVPEFMREQEQKQTADQNVKEVERQLRQRFGEKAGEALASKADELGVSVANLRDLAASSPKAVLAYFGESQTTSSEQMRSSVNSEAISGSHERGWNYYERMRKENPTEYYKPKVQRQLVADRERLGAENFYKH